MSRISFEQRMGKRLSLTEDNAFFGSFVLRGSERDLLGVERFPRIVDAAGLCICLEGGGDIVIGARACRVQRGDMCVVLPGDSVYIRRKSADFKGYVLACRPGFLMDSGIAVPSRTPAYLFIKDNPCVSLKGEEQRDLIRMCEFLKEHDAREDHPCREEISKSLGSAVIHEVIGIYRRKGPLRRPPCSRKRTLFFDFVRLVAGNYREQRDIEFYAGRLCITSRYLSAVCREVGGFTPKECIDRHIMIRARILLASTDMTILQISDELNFANASFFTQYFKKRAGVTPVKFRNLSGGM
ncbi:MAG: AraC family transcriptional regulator [Proteiniphilum sp.]|nr:AraC family transcriptional regulator [Proteiniphilum sp.]